MLQTIHVWVKLPQLPLYLWGVRSLSKIGRALGKPIFIDKYIANKIIGLYARILIEVEITQKLRETIIIKDMS